ncbi:MAG: hypothetical protein NTY38_21690 [Acidobacteria bacterium]|nr:hypothetical protein [Acidobacteriota bacterium]
MSTAIKHTFRVVGQQDRPLPGEGMARFMERRGRRILTAAGARWHSVEGRFLMSFPYHVMLDGQDEEIRRMVSGASAFGARYQSHSTPGLASGIYVRRNRSYSISSVDVRQRSRVRRGLERCQVEIVEPDVLLQQGLELNLDTMRRQGRFDPEFGDPKQWSRLVAAVRSTRQINAWGAFFEGRLAAYMITCREDGWLHILHQMSRLDLLEQHPNHALTFTVTRQAMQDVDLEAVCYGTQSLVATDGLDEYKQRLGYEFLPGSSAIQLHPQVAPVLTSRLVLGAVGRLRAHWPQVQRLERLSSVLDGAAASRAVPAPAPMLVRPDNLADGTL